MNRINKIYRLSDYFMKLAGPVRVSGPKLNLAPKSFKGVPKIPSGKIPGLAYNPSKNINFSKLNRGGFKGELDPSFNPLRDPINPNFIKNIIPSLKNIITSPITKGVYKGIGVVVGIATLYSIFGGKPTSKIHMFNK